MTDARQLLTRLDVGVELDLLVSVSRGARVAQIATDDLISGHHDISALVRSTALPGVARLLNRNLAALDTRRGLCAIQTDRLHQAVTIAALGQVRDHRLLARAVGVARCTALARVRPTERVGAEGQIAPALARVSTPGHVRAAHAGALSALHTVVVWVEDLLDWNTTQNLKVHQG